MRLLRWLQSFSSGRGKALLHYRRGMDEANQQNHKAAIDQYTMAVELAAGPDDVRAMALYNRALSHAAVGNEQAAIEDLDAVLAMKESLAKIKSAARQRLGRMRDQSARGGISNPSSAQDQGEGSRRCGDPQA